MMWAEVVGALVGALVLGVAVPWVGVRMLVPSLESSPRAQTTNYAGRTVFYGLGVVWLIWAGCAIVGGVGAAGLTSMATLAILTLAGPLALVAFALGLVDDAYGTSASRGFKGHVKAMLRGQLTTGGLKLVGVGAACLVVAGILGQVAPWGRSPDGRVTVAHVGLVVLAGAAIALTSNLVNLMDLRPGRALKSYVLLAVAGSVLWGVALARLGGGSTDVVSVGVEVGVLAVFVIGPVLATWRYDVGERGMLGDAGANPMGAVAGLLIVAGLPVWGLALYFVGVLALNAASERFSFSRAIESNGALRWLDSLGRNGRLGATLSESDQSRHHGETNHE